MDNAVVERWATFVMKADGTWDIQLWAGSQQINGKVFKIRVPVPVELLGQVVTAEVAA